MKKIYFVNHGPDRSHLWDSDFFDRLRDARTFAHNLPDTPTGYPRPYKIERAEYSESNIYGDTVTFKTVEVAA